MVPDNSITTSAHHNKTVMRNMYYVDMHCHPIIKPYSWSKTEKINSSGYSRNVKTSLWFNDPPTIGDKNWNKIIGLTKFTQSDFRTLRKGNVKIISACLNPVERGLFIFKGICKIIPPQLLKFVIEVSMKFIRMVRDKERNYFEELEEEYCFFLKEWENQDIIFPTRFELTRDYSEIQNHLKNKDKDIISVFFSIEGGHVFNNGGLKNSTKDKNILEDRIERVKKWPHPPLYVSLAHMMNNELCGHAKSLPSWMGIIIDQKKGMEKGFSRSGKVVLHKLLEDDPGRIFIDIKHMNLKSRKEYYEILDTDTKYQGNRIPVIASHGAVSGRPYENGMKEKIPYNQSKSPFQNENELKLYDAEVNFFDEEIIRMEKTGGFLGIMLDERRLSQEKLKVRKKRKQDRGEQLRYQAGLVWKQIRYIAEVLDDNDKFGWGTATIGSDYDGLVDPPDGYWTSDDFGILEENLICHAREYLNSNPPTSFKNPKNAKLTASEIIDLFMRGNALRFLKKYLNGGSGSKKELEGANLCEESRMTD